MPARRDGVSIRSRRPAHGAIDPTTENKRFPRFNEVVSLDGFEHGRHKDMNGIMRPLQRSSRPEGDNRPVVLRLVTGASAQCHFPYTLSNGVCTLRSPSPV